MWGVLGSVWAGRGLLSHGTECLDLGGWGQDEGWQRVSEELGGGCRAWERLCVSGSSRSSPTDSMYPQ